MNTIYKTEKILSHLDGYCTLEHYKQVSLDIPNQYKGLLNSAVESLFINSKISTENIDTDMQFSKEILQEFLLKFKSTTVDLIGDINSDVINKNDFYNWLKATTIDLTVVKSIDITKCPSLSIFLDSDGKIKINIDRIITLLDDIVIPLYSYIDYIFKYVANNANKEKLKPFNLTIFNKVVTDLPQLKDIYIKIEQQDLTVDNAIQQINNLEIFEELNPNRQYLVNNFIVDQDNGSTIILDPIQIADLQSNLKVVIDKANSVNNKILMLFTSQDINTFIDYCLSINKEITQENKFCIELFLCALKIYHHLDLILNTYIKSCCFESLSVIKSIKE